jgi:lipoprotein-anchoring transpeptidase ErfK/SrfK
VTLGDVRRPAGCQPVFPRSVVVSVVPAAGPDGRVPRYVWALLLVVLLVLGFALGGSLRAALASGPTTASAAADARAVADISVGGLAGSGAVARPRGLPLGAPAAVTQPAIAAATIFVRSPVRRGVPLPAKSGFGRRIVYQESTMHLWVVEADGSVTRDYPVTGRPGWPQVGTYQVFSKSVTAVSPRYHVTFDWMVSFAHGHTLPIGFHSIPRWMGSGKPIQSESSLGAPIGLGGCVRQRPVDAKWLYTWASMGTTVVVLR